MLEGSFWEGDGWRVLGFGKVTEVRLAGTTGTAVYLLLFLKENRGGSYTEQVALFLKELLEGPEENTAESEAAEPAIRWKGRDLKTVQLALEQFLRKLEYRTVLDQTDLETMGLAKGILPDFYQKAVAANVTKIIMY